jgi:hypothetical protein
MALQNYLGNAKILKMTERKMDFSCPEVLKKLSSRPGAVEIRASQIILPHFHLLPGKSLAKPGSQGFEEGFLGGKSSRKTGPGIPVPLAVSNLGGRKESLQQGRPPASMRLLQSARGGQIYAGSENHDEMLSRLQEKDKARQNCRALNPHNYIKLKLCIFNEIQ